jgi:hypothetical protein
MPPPRSLPNLRWAFFAFRLILSSLVDLATFTVSNTPEPITLLRGNCFYVNATDDCVLAAILPVLQETYPH